LQRLVIIISVAILAIALGFTLYSKRVAMPEPATPVDAVVTPIARSEPIQVEFELADLEGGTRKLSEWTGKHRIVNFWATWCGPCRREIPLLKAFQAQHGADGFQVIGVAVDFPEPVINYAKEAEFNYPILVGEQDAMAAAESSGISFVGLPFTMIVTTDGTLIGAHMGEIHQPKLDDIVKVLKQLDRGELDAAAARTTLHLL
jgi:thiol-disulfide isomerase/thioredoxin